MQTEKSQTSTMTQLESLSTESRKQAMIAGGCFWCVEADAEKLTGIIAADSGYAEGRNENPTYEDYSENGHREVVLLTYDPSKVTFRQIVVYAIKHMDPTDGEGSFGDRGNAYAPALYYSDVEEKQIIDDVIAHIDELKKYDKPLAIDVLPFQKFWTAEEYHQNYYKGTLSGVKYQYYRTASGRDAFIEKHWGDDTGPELPPRGGETEMQKMTNEPWVSFVKPDNTTLRSMLTDIQYKVTQEEGTEPSFRNEYDKNYDVGLYVDIVSGEPLFSSKDKFDSGTGWPSFVKPITPDAVTEHVDDGLFTTRTEIRSKRADSHLGHVFPDGPQDRGGLRYCMNSATLRFIPKADMEKEGYGAYLKFVE